MRSLLTRMAVLGAFAVSLAACSNGSGTTLPFAGPPNNAGANSGTFQAGANGTALLRFIQGSPDAGSPPSGSVDVCIDNLPMATGSPAVQYGKVSGAFATTGGVSHVLSVYNTVASNPGVECATAPGPYFGSAAIAATTLAVGNNVRWSIVLGGTTASKTRGLYVYGDPTFPTTPTNEAISHNAAPVFSTGKSGVGFGQCTTTVTPCATATALTGAGNVAIAKVATATASTVNAATTIATSPLATIPPGFFDGAGVAAGTPVPVTSIAAPAAVTGQPYVVMLFAIDGPAGGLNLVAYVESVVGLGF